ncbi:MAG: hypothetical protein ACI3YC_00275 [Alloprevotella sp.]
MKKTFKLAALAFSAFILSSCGSGSRSDSLLFGEIPSILVEWNSEVKKIRENPDIFKSEEEFKKADKKIKELCEQAEKDLTAAMDKIAGKEFEVTCEAPLKVSKPLSLSPNGFFGKSDLAPKFNLEGEVVAETDVPAAFPQDMVDYYVKMPQIKPIGQIVELVGLDAEGNELYSFTVGSFTTVVEGDKVIIKGGQVMKNDGLHLGKKKAEEYLKATSLKLRFQRTK